MCVGQEARGDYMVGSDLLRYNEAQKYLLLDVESEDLNLGFTRPWQISYGLATIKEILWVKTVYPLIPDLHVSAAAAAITRFNKNDYLSKARPVQEICDELDTHLYSADNQVVWQNGLGFDAYVLRNLRREVGKSSDWSYVERSLDTNALAKAYKKGWIPDKTDLIGWQYKMISYREKGLKTNLEALGKEFQINCNYGQLHDAEADIRLMYEVFKQLVWKIEI